MVTAQANESTAILDSRPPPYPVGDVVNPVDNKIKECRAQGLNDDQIVQELVKLGIVWNPETGSAIIGGIIDDTYRPHVSPSHQGIAGEKSPTTGIPTRGTRGNAAMVSDYVSYQALESTCLVVVWQLHLQEHTLIMLQHTWDVNRHILMALTLGLK
jgi:hypothetical protein